MLLRKTANVVVSALTATAAMLLAAPPAFAIDLSDNPLNRAAGVLNGILTGVNRNLEQGLQKFEKSALNVRVEGDGDNYRLQALNGTRRQYQVTKDELEYVFRAGLAEEATKACGGRDYAFAESSPPSQHAWNKWVAENTELDIRDRRQVAFILQPTPEYSLVWDVRCGQTGGWKYPGVRAMEYPLARYISVLEPAVRRMYPLHAAQGRSFLVYVPSGALLLKVYGHDLRTSEGHLGIFRQRMMNAAVVARLRQSGAQVQVHEYDNESDVGAQDGIYLQFRPTVFKLAAGGAVTATWNPLNQWSELMSPSIQTYGDELLAFGDAGATFALRGGN